jgi:uncharacterized membrane protein
VVLLDLFVFILFVMYLTVHARLGALEQERRNHSTTIADSVAALDRRLRDIETKLAELFNAPSVIARAAPASEAADDRERLNFLLATRQWTGPAPSEVEPRQPTTTADAPAQDAASDPVTPPSAPPPLPEQEAAAIEPGITEPERLDAEAAMDANEPAAAPTVAALAANESDQVAEGIAGTTEPPTIHAQGPAASRSLEERIGTRWTVWVGGLALALGAILLVRYSIESGFFGPRVRIALGFILAAALIGAGEFLRRRDMRPAAAMTVAYIPGMLTATGTVAGFGTIYAAYALYHFIGPSVAFVALGATALACMAAAALHGPALAGLGLIGALVTPLLTPSSNPSPWPVVIYVGVVAAAAHGLSRIQNWLWLSLGAAAGGAIWALLLFSGIESGFFTAAMTHITLQTALAAVAVAILRHAAVPDERSTPDLSANIVLVGAAALAIVALWLGSSTNHFGWAWLAGTATVTAVLALTAVRVAPAAPAISAAGVLVLAAMILWPPLATSFDRTPRPYVALIGFFRPDEPTLYGIASVCGCTGIAVLAALRLLRSGALPFVPAASYAGTAALTPLGGLAITYLRFAHGTASPTLAISAMVVALAYAAGAAVFLKARRASSGEPVLLGLGALASAAIAATACALVFALEGGVLTVAIALAAAGVAFVAVRLDIAALRWCVAALGVFVAARLGWDPRIVGSDLSTTPIFNWLLFGYGIPAASFALAARLLRSRGDDTPVRVADSLGVLFAAFLVFFEIRHAMNGGDPFAPGSGLLEQGLMTVASFGFAIVLTQLDAGRANIVFRLASLAAGAIGMGLAVIGLGLRFNPLLTTEPVEGGMILNALALSYLLPGLVAGLLAYFAQRSRPTWYWAGAGAISLGLCLAYLLLETRLLFHGMTVTWDLGATLAELGTDTTISLLVATGTALAFARTSSAFFERSLVAVGAFAGAICVVGLGLLHNPLLAPEPVAGNAIINALIPGYLLPALAASALAFMIGSSQRTYRSAAAAAALALGLAYLLLEVRLLFNGSSIVATRGAGVAELGIDVSILIAVTIALFYAARTRQSLWVARGAWVVGAIALGVDAIGLGLYANPLRTFEGVAGGAVLNTLLVGYGLPAALAFVLAREMNRNDEELCPWAFGLVARIAIIASLFAYVTLETRRIFQGDMLIYLRPTSEAEWYAYSAVWLLLGVALLAYGVWQRSKTVRLASAVFVVASVAKVFLFDLAGLEGVLRAFSFIGLGIALIGIGLAYQKLVFTGRDTPEADALGA